MDTERSVADHYTHGTLETAIIDALRAIGKDPDRLVHGDLAAIDEFHIGGRQATMDLAAQIALPARARVLDVGCGIGGAARFFAGECGWRIEGIDLTDEYVRVAQALSRRVGLGDKASFRQASATALPFADATFDGAYMIHVGMNIPDKGRVFAEVRRVLKPGGVFAIYDVMRESDGEFAYPVPWSSEPATNAVAASATYKELLAAAGFAIAQERSRRDSALEFFAQMRRRMAETVAKGGPPPPGLPILMGPTAPQKVANMVALLERGVISPTEIIARAA
jgi:ubiquinone/menaquinone biosynthesis C-methylase UbiE